MPIPYATAGEFWASGGARQHPIGCHCGDDGRCELAQLQAEELSERADP